MFFAATGTAYKSHSLAWLMTSQLVGLAAALDGGTTYGMPAGVHVTAPLTNTAGRRLRLRDGELVDTRFAQWALAEWRGHLADMAGHLHQPGSPWFSASIRELATRRLSELRQQREELAIALEREEERDSSPLTSDMSRNKGLTSEFKNNGDGIIFNQGLLQGKLRVPPFKVAATRDITMRLAAAAVQAMPAATVAATAPPRQEQQQPRPCLPPAQAVPLGLQALQCARAALWDVGWATEAEHPPAKLQQLQRWWDLAVSAIRAAASARPGPADGDGWEKGNVQRLLALRTEASAVSSSSALPSADVAVALRAGYLQLLECLVRRLAVAPAPESGGLLLDPSGCIDAAAWTQLLAFSDSRVTAALAASTAKVARRATQQLYAAAADMAGELTSAGVRPRDFEGAGGAAAVVPPAASGSLEVRTAVDALRKAGNRANAALRLAARVLGPNLGREPFTAWLRSAVAAADTAAVAAVVPAAATAPAPRGHGAEPGALQHQQHQHQEQRQLQQHGQPQGQQGREDAGAVPVQAAVASHRRRFGAALSLVVLQVLPAATRLADSLAPSWGAGKRLPETHGDAHWLSQVLCWVPLLAAAASPVSSVSEAAAGSGEACGNGVAAPAEDAASGAAAAAAEWERFLWVDAGLPRLLAVGMELAGARRACGHRHTSLEQAWTDALRALVVFTPQCLADALQAAAEGQQVKRGAEAEAAAEAREAPWQAAAGVGSGLAPAVGLPHLRRLLCPEGDMPEPELLAALERICKQAAEEGVDCGAAGDGDQGAAASNGLLPEELRRQWVAAAALLVPAAEARAALLPTCDNPRCTNLEGDSEAGLRLAGCGRCGGRVQYCSKECQTAHWRAGHKAECTGAQRTAAAGQVASTAAGSAVKG